mmetsp:Transcript_111252/g.314910  ORF Transcript_111252/g.314910 Transcript_111252/m.314910 type:complete len:1017 (+) Transcript_111252:136-3186(+)
MAAESGKAAHEQALWDAFKKFDVNGDGRIQKDEFHKLMKSIGNFSTPEIRQLFNEADADRSGEVNWREFIHWICSGTATRNMDASFRTSFSRLLKQEAKDEASYVEQASVSKQVKEYLRSSDDDVSKHDKRQLKKKLNRAKKEKMAAVNAESPRLRGEEQRASLGVEESYTGFQLPLPPTLEGASGLMQHYLLNGGGGEPLHPKYVSYLTTEFTRTYKARHPKPVVQTETPKPGRLIIVGDTHGQLADVLHIFHQLGTPAKQNRYLFNGDMVDRGPMSMEILLILFAFFLAEPECLIVHRGNHENEDMNALDADSGGGFSDEAMSKYGLLAYRRVLAAFRVMSLCSVVEREIFVVHGGLTRLKTLTLDYINSIEHHDCTSPHPQATSIKDQVFSDLLWSDPIGENGKYKSERGIGIKFGPDLTMKFCMHNRLRFVVRSHQVPEDGKGYAKQHDGRCVTIFSASNYCGNGGNYGAVLALTSEHFPKYEIYEHYAAPLSELPGLLGVQDWAAISDEQQRSQQQVTTAARWEKELEKMIIYVIEKKPGLWAHMVDMSLDPLLALEDWEEVLSELIEGSHPWAEAARHWGIVDGGGRVDMNAFLRRWVVILDLDQYKAFLANAVKQVYEAIISLDMDLSQTFGLFDADGDGTVELKEVRHVLGMFDLALTPAQLDRLTGQVFSYCLNSCPSSPPDGGGGQGHGGGAMRMNVEDFLGRFTLMYKTASEGNTPELEPWMQAALNKIGRLIIQTPAEQLLSEIEEAALKIQKSFRGLQARKTVAARKSVAVLNDDSLTSAPQKSLARPSRFAGKRETSLPGAGAAPVAASSEGVAKMCRLFSALDASGDGLVQIPEFVRGIEKVPGVRELTVDGRAISHEMLVDIAEAIDASNNGTINYLEFLHAFHTSGEGEKDVGSTLAEDITTVLFRHRAAIRMGCLYLDEEATGKVHADDFEKVLLGMNNALAKPERQLTATQISLLVEALQSSAEDEPDEKRLVDYESFFKSFTVTDTTRDTAAAGKP